MPHSLLGTLNGALKLLERLYLFELILIERRHRMEEALGSGVLEGSFLF